MKFSLKIFLAVFLVSATIATTSALVIMRLMVAQAQTEYLKRYQTFAQHVGVTFRQLDQTNDLIMKNALYVLREREREHGLPSNQDLMKLKKDLGVDTLYIINRAGKYIRSDWFLSVANDPKLRAYYGPKGPLTKSLFSYCPDYRTLVKPGGASEQETPIVPSGRAGWPFKFVMIPNIDGTRVLEADMPMHFIGDTLKNVVAADHGVASIGLFTPVGGALGYVESGEHLPSLSAPLDVKNIAFDVPQASSKGFVFYSKVPAAITNCCECRLSGIAGPDGSYYYILRTEVSRAALNVRLAGIRRFFFRMILILLVLSGIVASLVSSRLVARLTWFGERVKGIAQSKTLTARLRMPGNDEVAVLARTFDGMMEQLEAGQARLAAAEREKAFVELAHQVAHDIRSPLAALDSAISDVSQLPEEKRILVRGAVSRIHDIANNLIAKDRDARASPNNPATPTKSEGTSCELLSSHIGPLITEKRMKFREKIGVTIEDRLDANSYGLFAEIQPREFKRVLSNLIDNAVEALGARGRVRIDMAGQGDRIFLRIRDNGKGIPPDVLKRLGTKGETYGKPGGAGLGVFHAKESVESWGGAVEFESVLGSGTTATIRLPRASPPTWFIERLTISPGQPIVVLDDDSSIHQVWRGRFEALRAQELGIERFHFSAPTELRAWVDGNPAVNQSVFLLDYELVGHEETGMSLIEELGLGDRAILVTSHFEEQAVIADCRRLNVRMIPKGLAGFVPIQINGSQRPTTEEWSRRRHSPDAVLVDNDDLVLMTWKMAAKEKGLELLTVKTSDSILACADRISPDTPIYLDLELGGGLDGDELAQELHAKGFANLYIATGRAPETIQPIPWIKRVVGKEPPWS